MSGQPSPESVELAIELVNLFSRGSRAASAHCTLESLAFDQPARTQVALDIEDRWNTFVTETEQGEWTDIADVARTIERAQRMAA